MTALETMDQAEVGGFHAVAIASGDTDDGAPRFQTDYGTGFVAAYLYCPQGNKIANFSSHPDDLRRQRWPSPVLPSHVLTPLVGDTRDD